MDLSREKVAASISTAAGSLALCTELAWQGDVENLMLVLAAIARGATDWFDDAMRVELRPVGREACTVDVLIDMGDERHERLFRSFVLNVGTDVARARCTELEPKITPLFANVDLDGLVFSTFPRDDDEAEPATRRDTMIGLSKEVVTLPFGLPFAAPIMASVPSIRGAEAHPTDGTLPFGVPPDDEGSSR